MSCSFGLPDLNNSAWNAELLTAAGPGVTILSASGDQGNAPDSLTHRGDGPWPVWPATAAWNTSGSVSVGGVSISLSGSPSSDYNGSALNISYDPAAGPIASASAWYDTTQGPGAYAGTEGGASTVIPEPCWQFHSAAQPAIVNATLRQGATDRSAGRDRILAMPGNSTLVAIFANSTQAIFYAPVEGTSVAAPVLAGLLADVVAVENNGSVGPWTSLGFIDPEIYRFASFFAAHPGPTTRSPTSPQGATTSSRPRSVGTRPRAGARSARRPSSRPTGTRPCSIIDTTDRRSILPPASSSTGSSVPWVYIYAIFGVGFVIAVLLVVLSRLARPDCPPRSAVVPWGAQMGAPMVPASPGPPGTLPGATFLCPYCGAMRPSEPVRCPQCGAYQEGNGGSAGGASSAAPVSGEPSGGTSGDAGGVAVTSSVPPSPGAGTDGAIPSFCSRKRRISSGWWRRCRSTRRTAGS